MKINVIKNCKSIRKITFLTIWLSSGSVNIKSLEAERLNGTSLRLNVLCNSRREKGHVESMNLFIEDRIVFGDKECFSDKDCQKKE